MTSEPVLFNLFLIVEPLIYFRVCHRTLNKLKKHELLVRKSNISLLDTSTNKQLLQKLKSKEFNDSVVLTFLECICYIQDLAKKTYLKYVSVHFLALTIELHLVRFGLGAPFTFELHSLLITVHTFAVVIISLHIKICYFASTGLTIQQKIGFYTVFSSFPQRLNSSSSPLSTLYYSDTQYCRVANLF